MVEIRVYDNGVHSLSTGLRAFRNFHNDATKKYDLKDAILRVDHGLETLFKNVLLHVNPVYLFPGNYKVENFVESVRVAMDTPWQRAGVTKFPGIISIEGEKTITLIEALDRLRTLFGTAFLSEQQFHHIKGAANDLRKFRNRLQHLGLQADEEILARTLGNLVPSAIDALTKFYPDLIANLDSLDPDSAETIELLRNRYDKLVREAVDFFKGNTFERCELRVSIADRGPGGAPPYLPDISLEGFVSLQLSRFDFDQQPNIVRYDANVKVSPRPQKQGASDDPFSQEIENDFKVTAHVITRSAEGVLILADAAEHLPFLRNVEVNITAQATYRALGHLDGGHFQVHRVLELEGKLDLDISTSSMGMSSSAIEPEIIGAYSADLTKDNAPFSLNDFVQPDGALSGNHTLRWHINAVEPLRFR